FLWDGICVDGIWGTIKGLGTLVGFQGWDAMKQAWKGLAQLATGLAFMSNPFLGALFWATPDKYMPSWLRESRNTMKQTGKALLAWDEWGKNPARAAGGVTFNVLTTVFTGGEGAALAGAGKAGAVAKAISVAGKVGKFIDPMTYVMKGAGAGLSKIGDITKALKGAGKIDIPTLPDNAITLPEGTVHLPDGTVHLPEGAPLPKGGIELPNGTVQLPHDAPLHPAGTDPLHTPEGEPQLFADKDGNIVDERGNVLMHHQGGPPDITTQPHTTPDTPHTPTPAREPALVGATTHTADTAAHAGDHINLGNSLDTNLGDTGRTGEHVPTTPGVHAGGDIPGVHAGDHLPGGGHLPGNGLGDHLPGGTADHLPGGAADHLPGGRADTHMPTNSVDTHVPAGTTDHPVPGSGAGEHSPGGHTGGPGTPSHDLPGHSGDTHVPGHGGEPPTGGSGLGDDVPGAGDHASSGSDAGTPAHDARPSFMHDGDNPYGPEGSLTDKQIHDIQVYRANHEPGYFEEFYKSNGNRKNLKFVDESGTRPPQLTRESPQHPWVSVKDAPEPLQPHYLGDEIKGGRETASHEAVKKLDEAAANRHHAIGYDTAAGKHKGEAIEAHKHNPTPETDLDRLERTNEYKSAHRDMRDHAEAYGEAIAEHHVIPEHYPNATREPLDGPLNGNDQFDQVWRREDGGFVVVEAKSSVTTDLGARNLPSGRRVSQGTREYFLDIIREMKKRGETNPAEQRLARELEDALDHKKLDYIVVRGQKNAGEYAGYSVKKFDITDRSMP
ncbi:hypothetical protein ACWC2T_45650, partial [Streptomyces sp. NPDC001393]